MQRKAILAISAALLAVTVGLSVLFGSCTSAASLSAGGAGSAASASGSSDGSAVKKKGSAVQKKEDAGTSAAPTDSGQEVSEMPAELRGMWITYFELAALFDSDEGFQKSFETMLDRCEQYQINAVFVHVRSHCDAYYPSKYFPWSKYVSGIKGTQGKDPGFDPLAYMIESAHRRGIQFHAWINPYRVSFDSTDLSLLADSNPAKIWLTDSDTNNDTWVVKAKGGLYLNPAVSETQALVINGIREIVENYEVDGIHFDDYFYPTTDEAFDEREYARYRMEVWGSPLSLEDFRRANVNALVSRAYDTVKSLRPSCSFGISPMAGIRNNYVTVYADIAAWLEGGYIDYVMPQIYFGFEYPQESSRFDALLKEWDDLVSRYEVSLYVGLGAYRIGSTDENNVEWSRYSDILARQVSCTRDDAECGGFVLYSYSTFFTEDEAHQAERQALSELLNADTQ